MVKVTKSIREHLIDNTKEQVLLIADSLVDMEFPKGKNFISYDRAIELASGIYNCVLLNEQKLILANIAGCEIIN